MKNRMISIIFGFLLLYVAITLYIGWNGRVFWNTVFGPSTGWAFTTVWALLAYGYLAAMLLRRILPYPVYSAVKLIGTYGLGICMYALLSLPIADVAVALLRWSGMETSAAVSIVGWIVVLLIALVLAIGSRNAWSPVVRRYDIRIDKEAGPRKELRIAVASDLHLGTTIGKPHLARLVERVQALQPDLVLLPGDVLDDSIEPFVRERMGEVLGRLSAPLGVYASLGNHEYIGGHIDEYVERMKAIGIRVLLDEVVLVEDSFYVAGRKDAAVARVDKSGRLSVAELLKGTDPVVPVVLLDHQPRDFGTAAAAGADLMLSGHTHRGQLMPGHLITRRMFELDWGYLRKEAMHVIVSSGFGFWGPPIRIGSRSEVLDIRVTFGREG
ncbi:metallophosphoesterase [Paenibacillus hodogayensis]|uniref:Metallophosphoesterase n=1 Tax=Paenibacillus hodogayensis TaxID=279208 RepID=A0ABV5VS23_9BACL